MYISPRSVYIPYTGCVTFNVIHIKNLHLHGGGDFQKKYNQKINYTISNRLIRNAPMLLLDANLALLCTVSTSNNTCGQWNWRRFPC